MLMEVELERESFSIDDTFTQRIHDCRHTTGFSNSVLHANYIVITKDTLIVSQ